jgi:hypothetical protein
MFVVEHEELRLREDRLRKANIVSFYLYTAAFSKRMTMASGMT